MKITLSIKGYKIFGPGYTCMDYTYDLKNANMYTSSIEVGKSGLHFCPKAMDCLNYYKYSVVNTYAIVQSIGDCIVKDDKVVTNGLIIVRKLSYLEFGELLNYCVDTPHEKYTVIKGKKQGTYLEFYSNNKIYKELNYVNGIKNGLCKIFHQNGSLDNEYYIKNGLKNGIYRKYHINGQLNEECMFVNDYLDGPYKNWYACGQLKYQYTYNKNKIHGELKTWYVDGNMAEQSYYKHGLLIQTIYYKN